MTDAEFYELQPVTPEVDALAHRLYDEVREFGSPAEWPNHATNYWRDVAARVAA